MEVPLHPTYQDFAASRAQMSYRVPVTPIPARDALPDASAARDMLADASHELKTPLSSIRNSLTLLKIGAAGPISKDAQDVLDVVERNTTRLMNLVEEILCAQRTALVFETLAADSLIASAIEMVSGDLTAKNIDLQFSPSNLLLKGDEKRIVQVLVNLLSNAIKFSPTNGSIKLQARTQSNRSVTILVSDQGVGVPENDLDRIFLRHEQGSFKSEQGTGLGLAISKQIIENHGGQIGAYNNGVECSGATFWIRLTRANNSVEHLNSSSALSDGRVA